MCGDCPVDMQQLKNLHQTRTNLIKRQLNILICLNNLLNTHSTLIDSLMMYILIGNDINQNVERFDNCIRIKMGAIVTDETAE